LTNQQLVFQFAPAEAPRVIELIRISNPLKGALFIATQKAGKIVALHFSVFCMTFRESCLEDGRL